MLLAIHLAAAAFFLLLGVMFLCGRGGSLIAGYNTLPPEERDKIDKRRLTRFMAKLMFALAGCWLVVAASEIFRTMALLWIGLALALVVSAAGCVYANTGNRFRRR